jgi:hypothetical protein
LGELVVNGMTALLGRADGGARSRLSVVDVRRFVTGDGRTVRASAEIATNSLFYLADRGIAMQTADGIGRMRIFVTLRRKPDRMKGGPVSDPRGSKAYKQRALPAATPFRCRPMHQIARQTQGAFLYAAHVRVTASAFNRRSK